MKTDLISARENVLRLPAFHWTSFQPVVLTFLILLIGAACQPSPSAELHSIAAPTETSLQTRIPPTLPVAPSATPTDPVPTHKAHTSNVSSSTPDFTHTAILPSETSQPITTTLLFTGIVVPARCVQAKIDLVGNPNYPYEEVRELISSADLSIGSFNSVMSERVEQTGCLTTWQLVGRPTNADAAAWAGFDLMSVATNHIKDCGLMKSWCDYTFIDTLENLKRVGIKTVGGGSNLDEALQPVIIEMNGTRFGFISLGESKMDPIVFAKEGHPGIAQLTPGNIRLALDLVRQQADVIIALPHWGPEDSQVPNWNQTELARLLASGGADLIVGNHTHVIQAIKDIDGVPVFYGLGNFVFDQGLRDHRQGVILMVDFFGSEYAGYRLVPTHTDGDGRVHIADPLEAAEILDNIQTASQLTR